MADNETNQDDFVKILLDEPVKEGKLGFEVYADVLTNIILGGDTPFTIGIFGDWGTGKTTLMKMVEGKLEEHIKTARSPKVIPVWFEAWRYERESELILPLLNTIAEAVKRHDRGLGNKVKAALRTLGRGLLSVLRGFTFGAEIKTPGVSASVEYDPEKTFVYWEKLRKTMPGSSEYEKAYQRLREEIGKFAKPTGHEYQNKFVVFIDDLDRCLPKPALAVLEAVKVFLGFPGMVYVLGLNRAIIQRCVEIKYCHRGEKLEEHPYGPDLGDEYIKKIVQVPFAIPPGTQREMDGLVQGLISEENLPNELRRPIADLLPHDPEEYLKFDQQPKKLELPGLEKVCDIATIYLQQKPREMKRLLNAYIVSSDMTRAELKDTPGTPFNPLITVSLLVLRFLDEDTYNRLVADSTDQYRDLLYRQACRELNVDIGANAEDAGTEDNTPEPTPPQPGRIASGARDDETRRKVAQLLLHTQLLEFPPEQIQAHARATTVTVTPETEEPGDGPLTREEALKLLRASNIMYFNRRRAETDYQLLDLSGVDLHQLNLTQHLHLGGFGQVAFNAATFGGDGGLLSVDLRKVVLVAANLSQANLMGADLRDADLTGANLRQAVVTGADLSRADLHGADLDDADLRRAVLRGANLTRARLWGANLSEADLGKAVLRRGHLPGIVLREADLSEADLSGAEAPGANLTAANLSGADLSDADLNRADLTGADLRAANLRGTKIHYADFAEADLTDASLEGACEIETANFYKANLTGTILEGKGLEDVDRSKDPDWRA